MSKHETDLGYDTPADYTIVTCSATQPLPPPTWREFFVSEGIPHRTDEEVEKICSSHCIEPTDFDKPVQRRYWEDWLDITGGPLARAYHLLQRIDLGPERDSGRGPLLEFNVGSHPGDSTHYVNAKDMLWLFPATGAAA